MRQEITEIILGVLGKWEDLQPNMKSRACQRLLAKELANPLEEHIKNLIEEIILGTQTE